MKSAIKQHRIAAGLTQKQLADILEVRQSAVANWESGLSVPRTEMLPKLAEVLGCTIDELFEKEAS